MNIVKTDGSKLFVKVRDYEPSIKINYTLVPLSSNKIRSIDRGPNTDRYECKFIFSGTKTDMSDLINCLMTLRLDKKEVVLTDIECNFFGEHVDHNVDIHTVVGSISEMVSPRLNGYTFDVNLIATNLTFLP